MTCPPPTLTVLQARGSCHHIGSQEQQERHLPSVESPMLSILHLAWSAWDTSAIPLDSQGLRPVVLGHMASSLATLLHEDRME